MDTSLMNLMHDDVFDGNYNVYNAYDSTSEFWTSNEEMQMQLAEALEGILPIPPTEDFHLDDRTSVNVEDAKNPFKFDDLTEQHLVGEHDEGEDIITTASVDPHVVYSYDTDCDENINCDVVTDIADDHEEEDIFDENDQQSLYSEPTIYGSHADSCSASGDYESHSSDYDTDDDDDDDDTYTNCDNDCNQNLHEVDRTVGIDALPINEVPDVLQNENNANHDSISPKLYADDLDLNIDVQNFDLAEFITKEDDDFPLDYNVVPHTAVTSASNIKLQDSIENVVRVIPHNDSDSDIIIDVESVEPEEQRDVRTPMKPLFPETEYIDMTPEDDTPFVDNVKDDPSWLPSPPASSLRKQNTAHKEVAAKKQIKSNGGKKATSASKKLQSVCSKGKSSKPTVAVKAKVSKPLDNKALKVKGSSQVKATSEQKESTKRIPSSQNITGGAASNKKKVTVVPKEADDKVRKEVQQQSSIPNATQKAEAPAQKRKLNLEEYKMRLKERLKQNNANNSNFQKEMQIKNIVGQSEKNKTTATGPNGNNNRTPQSQVLTQAKHSEMVISAVNALKEQTKDSKRLDPITEAKNKVLRMQELKKARQLRILDSTVLAKIPKVTKVLPLEEIIKGSPYLGKAEEDNEIHNSSRINNRLDYDEIIIVSVSCNTDITIPPYKFQAENSLLKPYRLLSTIKNTLQTVQTKDNVKLSTNSLLSSIEGVVIKKSLPPISNERLPSAPPDYCEEHGENKIIMHLSKNRERKTTSTVAVQTDLQAAFPPLTLIKIHLQRTPRERKRTKRKKNCRNRSDDSSASSISHSSHQQEYDSLAKTVESAAGVTRHHSPDGSYSSVDCRRTNDSTMPTGGYSSQSTRRHRSSVSSSYSECMVNVSGNRRQRRTSYKQRSKKRSSSPYESSSSSSVSDCKRSCSRDYKRSRSRSRSRSNSHSKIRNRIRRTTSRQRKDHRRKNNNPEAAVEERRIVYVGRIEQETSKEKLLLKFSCYGTIKNISIHYKEDGMKYGFLTFERSCDAFAAIDNAIRDPRINMYDVSFGGRREFCRASYADLDNAGINTYESYVYPKPNIQVNQDTFESLLQKMKDKLNANKSNLKPLSSPSTDTKI